MGIWISLKIDTRSLAEAKGVRSSIDYSFMWTASSCAPSDKKQLSTRLEFFLSTCNKLLSSEKTASKSLHQKMKIKNDFSRDKGREGGISSRNCGGEKLSEYDKETLPVWIGWGCGGGE